MAFLNVVAKHMYGLMKNAVNISRLFILNHSVYVCITFLDESETVCLSLLDSCCLQIRKNFC